MKQHSLAHMPFGHGQRSCIAMRLALMEAKMAFVGILKEYQFIEAPDTEKVRSIISQTCSYSS